MNKIYLIIFLSFQALACSDLLDTDIRMLDSSEVTNLCEYKDDVILVVNVTRRCGFPYQNESLQALYENYKNIELELETLKQKELITKFLKMENEKLRTLINESINSKAILVKVLIDKESPFLKSIIFFLLFAPTAFTMRLFKRDELKLHFRKKNSYWINRSVPINPDSFKNQF